MKRLLLLLLPLTACSAVLSALDPGVDAVRLDERLKARAVGAHGFVQTTWLCLLHGRGCERLTQTPSLWLPEPEALLEAQLALALASDGLGAVAPRLDAWLALADVAAHALPADSDRADRLLTVAVEALGKLALRDHALVTTRIQAQPAVLQRWLSVGSTIERWRRQRSLASWLDLAQPHVQGLATVPLALALVPQPLSRRLFTGLTQVADVLPPTTAARLLPPPETPSRGRLSAAAGTNPSHRTASASRAFRIMARRRTLWAAHRRTRLPRN